MDSEFASKWRNEFELLLDDWATATERGGDADPTKWCSMMKLLDDAVAEMRRSSAVPDDLRKLVETQFDHCPFCGGGLDTGWECSYCNRDSKPIVDAVLSLPAGPAAPPQPDGELQRLLDKTRGDINQYGTTTDRSMFTLVEAMAKRLGAR